MGRATAIAFGDDRKSLTEQGCLLRPDRTVSCFRNGSFEREALAAAPLDPLAEQRTASVWVYCPMIVKRSTPDVRAIAMGSKRGALLTEDGAILTWGDNAAGQLGRPSTPSFDDVPGRVPGTFEELVAAEQSTCGLARGGAVFCWGALVTSHAPKRIEGLPPARHIYLSGTAACALAEGAIWCWGGYSLPFRDAEHLREIAGVAHGRRDATPRRIDF